MYIEELGWEPGGHELQEQLVGKRVRVGREGQHVKIAQCLCDGDGDPKRGEGKRLP